MIVLAMALWAASGAAQSEAAPAVESSRPVDPDAKTECRRIRLTGSRLPAKRYCLSVFEWRVIAGRAQREVGELKRQTQMENLPVF